MIRHIINIVLAIVLLIPATTAIGQQAFWIPLGTDAGIGIVLTTDGRVVTFTKLTIINAVTPPPIVTPPPTINKVTKATYVYDKDTAPIPPQIAATLNKINVGGSGVVADEYEAHNTTGAGTVPKQFEKQFAAAKADKDGLPALVVMSGDVVFKIVHDPKTAKDVEDALK